MPWHDAQLKVGTSSRGAILSSAAADMQLVALFRDLQIGRCISATWYLEWTVATR